MTDTTRPLVTFALFAYNQEKYIREAVEGAFSQTYEPLEIILSDDCSSDRTFEIMQEMAAAYDGPHEVRVRQNHTNFGLIGHVNALLEIVSGDTIVLAAGDDISEAARVAKIAAVFDENPSAMLVHSMVQTLDASGKKMGLKAPPNLDAHIMDIATSASIYIGATGAIKRDLYRIYGPISEARTYEDLIFGFRAALMGGIFYLENPLVQYRSDIGLASQFRRTNGSRKERRIASICHRLATLRQRRVDLNSQRHLNYQKISKAIKNEEKKAVARFQFYVEPLAFLRGTLSTSAYAYLKALSSETKYALHLIG
jgi:glycosyltransferase involved in cell wall biosynthesis